MRHRDSFKRHGTETLNDDSTFRSNAVFWRNYLCAVSQFGDTK